MRESGPRKTDEDGDDDGDVDETIIAAMIPLPMALQCHREREEERFSTLCFLLHGLPLDGERFSLWSLAFMVMMAPPGSSSMPSGDHGHSGRVPERA